MALNAAERYQAQIGLTDAHRTERYLTMVAERDRKWSLVFSCVTALSALGSATFAGIVLSLDKYNVFQLIGLLAGSVAGVSSILAIVFDFSKRSTRASVLAKESALLAAEWRTMLLSRNGHDHNSLEQLSKRQKETEAPVSIDIPFRRRLNKRASDQARAQVMLEIHHKKLEDKSEQRPRETKGTKATTTT